MNRNDFALRKLEVMVGAAERWQAKAQEVVGTARRLARGGPLEAASPERAALFNAREARKRTRREPIGFERKIGSTLDWDDMPQTATARTAGRPVARIVELLATNRIGDGLATGFLASSNLLLTNWHVFPEQVDAASCGAQFGFERNESGLLDNGVVFELDPDMFFYSDETLDIAIVGVKETPLIGAGTLIRYGQVKLIPSQGKILVGHRVSIIQHPDGQHKHWATQKNTLLLDPKESDRFLTYSTDTLEGSSGSPAFNYDWELVAVHHSGVPHRVNGNILTLSGKVWNREMPDSDIHWVANEGVRVSKICAHLKQVRMQNAAQNAMLVALVSEATDPVKSGEAAQLVMPANDSRSERSERAMEIIVNGTANFYFDKEPTSLASVQSLQVGSAPASNAIVAPEKRLRFDSDYITRVGYRDAFLSEERVPAPEAPLDEVLCEGSEAKVLKYHHYSLVMHKKRRLAMWAAANVDYGVGKRWRDREDFGSDQWKPDPRIPIEAQIEDLEFYAPAAKFDRGHIVRRDDVAWGETKQEEEFGNSDSFHWTNCTPQHERFNRDAFGYKGLWGGLENHIAKQASFLGNRLILFAGPVLDPDDPKRDFGSGIEVQIPVVFWKVLIALEGEGANGTLRAYGFLLDQTEAINEYGWEARFRVGRFKEYQVDLSEISTRSRVKFDPLLHAADPLGNVVAENRHLLLNSLEDVKLR